MFVLYPGYCNMLYKNADYQGIEHIFLAGNFFCKMAVKSC